MNIHLCYGYESLRVSRAIALTAREYAPGIIVSLVKVPDEMRSKNVAIVELPSGGLLNYLKGLVLFRRRCHPMRTACEELNLRIFMPHPLHYSGNWFARNFPHAEFHLLCDGEAHYSRSRSAADPSCVDIAARRVLGFLFGVPYRQMKRSQHLSCDAEISYARAWTFEPSGFVPRANEVVRLVRDEGQYLEPGSGVLFLDQEIAEIFPSATAAALRARAMAQAARIGRPLWYKPHPRGRDRYQSLRDSFPQLRRAPDGPAEMVAASLRPAAIVSFYSTALTELAGKGPTVFSVLPPPETYTKFGLDDFATRARRAGVVLLEEDI